MKLANSYEVVLQPSQHQSGALQVALRVEHGGGKVVHRLWDGYTNFSEAMDDARKAIRVLEVIGAKPCPEPLDEPF